ncbi:MAG TPA: FxDxF family PEP-CTERM protein [Candidatus Aquabacterium excrementipullorum]|nr:FxDxF family PEP-CTERM protein [Candidatus Aquabacterium excrementipullorum]
MSFASLASATTYSVSGTVASGTRTVTLDADGTTTGVVDPFVVASLSDVSLNLSSLLSTVQFPSFTLTLQPISFSGATLASYTFTDLTTAANTLVGTFSNVAAGSYYLSFTSTAAAGGGTYSGSVSVSAVPEPEALALLLAGVGVVGASRLRSRKAA